MIASSETRLDACLRTAGLRLRAAGISDGRREAEWLLAHALGCSRLDLYRSNRTAATDDQDRTFSALLERRIAREPLQYLLGTQEFWGFQFRVTPDVLIPRPETEQMIETALARFPSTDSPLLLLDLCTGSGCLGVALARLYPNARIVATDLSGAALEVARQNAAVHGVEKRIRFLQGDLFDPLRDTDLPGRVDAIVSNPPYVPTPDLAGLQPEVRLFEPRMALDGGRGGLDFYPRILAGARNILRPGGALFLEVGIHQADRVREAAEGAGWRWTETVRDLAGIPRMIHLENPEAALRG